MSFNILTGQNESDGIDLSGTTLDSVGYVLPDVSQGAPDMSPSTPTGNGTGYYIPPATPSSFDTLTQVLNAALQADQIYTQRRTGIAPVAQMTAIQNSAAQQRQRQNMFLLLCGLGMLALFAEAEKK